MAEPVRQDGPDVLVRVKAVPGASRDEIAGVLGDRLKVRVRAPPEGGRANQASCALVAAAVGVKPSRVRLESGASSPEKTLRVSGIVAETVRDALESRE